MEPDIQIPPESNTPVEAAGRATLAVHEDGVLWSQARPLRFLGLEFGTRMGVVKLIDGSLFVHSPTRLDDETRTALDELGEVRHVVAPNKLHHLFIADYAAAYPDARLYAPPGLRKRRPNIRFHAELTDHAPAGWSGEIDQLVFRGHPWMEEVVFFHRASRTLMVADLLMYFGENAAPMTRLLARTFGMYGKPCLPTDFRWTITDRQAARRSVARILDWDFDRILLAHGQAIHRNGKRAVRNAFAWLFR